MLTLAMEKEGRATTQFLSLISWTWSRRFSEKLNKIYHFNGEALSHVHVVFGCTYKCCEDLLSFLVRARSHIRRVVVARWVIHMGRLSGRFFFANWVRLRRLLRNAASSRQQEHNNINNNISENFNIPTWCSFAALKKSLFLDRGHTYIVCVDMVISRESLDRNDTKTAPRRRRRYVCIMQRREETG